MKEKQEKGTNWTKPEKESRCVSRLVEQFEKG